MEGRRVQRNAPKRNPLYLIFIGLCTAVLLLLIIVAVLSFQLAKANKELSQVQSRLEQYEPDALLPGNGQDAEETDSGRVPGDDVEATEPTAVPESDTNANSGTNANTGNKTEVKVGWLDLTGHKEVQTAPKSVFDKYYVYYTAESVNLRGGPGTSYERIRTLERGIEVKGAAKDGGWTFVSVDGKFGWVSSDYLSTTRPETPQETGTPENAIPSEQPETPADVSETAPSAPTEEEQALDWLLE